MVEAEKIKAFFFEAMRGGYVNQRPFKLPLPDPFSGEEAIPYRRNFKDGFYLLDYYFVSPDSNSCYGSTVIWFEEKPIWVMHYGGWYDERVIPFLKRALARNYNEDVFLGGRGPEFLEGEDHTLQYFNKVEQNDFNDFRGREGIITTSEQWKVAVGTKLGEHHYLGGRL